MTTKSGVYDDGYGDPPPLPLRQFQFMLALHVLRAGEIELGQVHEMFQEGDTTVFYRDRQQERVLAAMTRNRKGT